VENLTTTLKKLPVPIPLFKNFQLYTKKKSAPLLKQLQLYIKN